MLIEFSSLLRTDRKNKCKFTKTIQWNFEEILRSSEWERSEDFDPELLSVDTKK